MEDPGLIACLYPAGNHASITRALGMISMADESLRISPLRQDVDRSRASSQSLDDGGDSDDTDDALSQRPEEVNNTPCHDYSPGIQLRFDHLRKNSLGFVFGTDPGCDIVFPKKDTLSGLGRYQCVICFDHQGRLILRDLRQPGRKKDGTFVTYNERGGFKRRGFTWILGGDNFFKRRPKTITIAFHMDLQFHIVVTPHDIGSDIHKDRVAQFRRAVAANVDDLPIQALGFESLESTAAPTGAQTPSRDAILLNNGELGRGGQAVVARVWNVSTGLDYASKEPLHEKYWDRLRREATLLRQINHDNIVRLIHSTDEPVPRLILEYVPLGTLQQQARKQAISAKETLAILHQGLSALRHLHERDDLIAHRDIKPENILVQSREPRLQIKLSDFGFSKENQDYLSTMCGTQYYAAPEVFAGERYDESVDIWSLGLVVLQYAHGLPPLDKVFSGVAWANKIINCLNASAESGNSPLLAFLSRSMLLRSPGSRYSAYRCYGEACQLHVSRGGSSTPTSTSQSTVVIPDGQRTGPRDLQTALRCDVQDECGEDQLTEGPSSSKAATVTRPKSSAGHPHTSTDSERHTRSDSVPAESAAARAAKRRTTRESRPSSPSSGSRKRSRSGGLQRPSRSEIRYFYEEFSNPLHPLYVGSSIAILDDSNADTEADESLRHSALRNPIQNTDGQGQESSFIPEDWLQLQRPISAEHRQSPVPRLNPHASHGGDQGRQVDDVYTASDEHTAAALLRAMGQKTSG